MLTSSMQPSKSDKGKVVTLSLSSSEFNNDDEELQGSRMGAMCLLNTSWGQVGEPTKQRQPQAMSNVLMYANQGLPYRSVLVYQSAIGTVRTKTIVTVGCL